jgi:hypothetical protein
MMQDMVIDDQLWKSLRFLSDYGVLRPIAELIEKLNLNEDDMKILSDLVHKKIKEKNCLGKI